MLGQMSAFIFAVSYLPLADLGAIFAVVPLLVILLAFLLLGEPIGPRRAASIALGFVGVLIIIRPGTGVFDPISLIALAGATCWACFHVAAIRLPYAAVGGRHELPGISGYP